jgi:hypothetical protein
MEQKEVIFKPDPSIVIEKLKRIISWKCTEIGLFLIIVGLLWGAKDLGLVTPKVFWPVLCIVVGILCLVKANFIRNYKV